MPDEWIACRGRSVIRGYRAVKAGRSLLVLLAGTALVAAALWLMPAKQRNVLTGEVRRLAGLVVEGDLLRTPGERPPADANAAEADAQAGGEARVGFVDGVPVVQLSAELQKKTGIRLEAATVVIRRPEFRAYGEVADIGPLIKLRSRQGRAQSARDIATAALIASDHELKRLRALRKDGASVPAKQMQEAEARYEGDRAQLEAAQRQLDAISEEAVQQWGPELAGWALKGDSPEFQRLLNRQDVLLLVGLPANRSLPPDTSMVYADRNGERSHARKALLVAAAPQTDSATQGETWYFRTAAGQLRTGMRLAIWVPQPGPGVAGVEIPYSAVVWYAGKPWIYVEPAPGRFVRRSVGRHTENGREWFVRAGLKSGERFVVTGGQMLLSEEFRWQIPEEDND